MENKKTPEWAKAEQEMARLLTDLVHDGYIVLNDVKFKYGNIDHLVIRKDKTIFLVECKSHKGRVSTDGKQLLLNGRPFKTNYFCQINRTIRWNRRVLKEIWGRNTWIVAIIVFPNADVRIKKSVKRVNILCKSELLQFIRSYKR